MNSEIFKKTEKYLRDIYIQPAIRFIVNYQEVSEKKSNLLSLIKVTAFMMSIESYISGVFLPETFD